MLKKNPYIFLFMLVMAVVFASVGYFLNGETLLPLGTAVLGLIVGIVIGFLWGIYGILHLLKDQGYTLKDMQVTKINS